MVSPADSIVILEPNSKVAVACVAGDFIAAERIEGSVLTKSARLGYVEKAAFDGWQFELNDGSKWKVDDNYYTSFWLPRYPVLLDGSEDELINLKELRRVQVMRVSN